MEPALRCNSCEAALPRTFDRMCPRCGWDNQVQMRKCLQCKAAVSLRETIGYGAIIGGGFLGAAGLWRFLGGPLSGAVMGALGALCGLITLATLGYKCGGCGKRAEGRVLSKDERQAILRRRLGYLIGSIVLAVGSLILLLRFRQG